MITYYNEIEPYAVQWLRNLMDAGEIAPGTVDDRSILDVTPRELLGYDRCHFFAGIAGWDYALRLAGWPADIPVWTGSCPCQPFSTAGKREGGADERHLWPAWYWLIRQCRPPIIFGEQVASKDGLRWLDVVLADLEAAGYSCGSVDLCAASVGAPHIRQRLWFCGILGITSESRCQGNLASEIRRERKVTGEYARPSGPSPTQPLGKDSSCLRWRGGSDGDKTGEQGSLQIKRFGSINDPWTNLHWLPCRDRKWRPTGIVADHSLSGFIREKEFENNGEDSISWGRFNLGDGNESANSTEGRTVEPNILRLVDGLPARLGIAFSHSDPEKMIISPLISKSWSRVGRLRAYGNAIIPQVAAEFIKAVMEILGE